MKSRNPHFRRSRKQRWFFIAVFALGFVLSSVCIASAEGFAIRKKISIPGQGSWDYLAVDEGARRLYVSHGTQVEVLDVDSGAMTSHSVLGVNRMFLIRSMMPGS